MSDFDEFKSYRDLADHLYEAMTPDQILECLRMLALHLADYRSRFGEIPKQDLLDLAEATELTDQHAQLLKDGMQRLVGYLASVRDGWEEEDAPIH
jgi:hypothetical protein